MNVFELKQKQIDLKKELETIDNMMVKKPEEFDLLERIKEGTQIEYNRVVKQLTKLLS